MSKIRLAFVAATILATLYSSLALYGWISWPIDFRVFWNAATQPLAEVYTPGKMPFAYPPTALFLFKPLALLPRAPAYLVWTSVSLVLFAVAVTGHGGWKLAIASLVTPASIRGLMLGQSAMLLGGGLLVAAALPSLAMGMMFGLIGAIKPQLVLFAPLAFIVRRDWKALFGMLGSGSGLVIASGLVFGPSLWADWVRSMPAFHDTVMNGTTLEYLITPAGKVEGLGYSPLPVLLLALALGAWAVIATARKVEREMLVALIVAASLLASPYGHIHDTIALVPACILLLFRGRWLLAIPAALIVTGSVMLVPVGLALFIAALIAGPDRSARSPDLLATCQRDGT